MYTSTPVITIFGSSVHILDSSFRDNKGAIYMEETAGALVPFLEVINTTFERNGPHYLAGDCRYDDRGKCGALATYKNGSGAELHGGRAAFAECTFLENNAGYGGGLFVDGAYVTLENRTKFVGNWAQFEGFSIYISSGWLRYLLPAPLGHWVGAATRWIPKDDDEIADGYNREIPDQLLWRWQRDLEELNGTDCTTATSERRSTMAGSCDVAAGNRARRSASPDHELVGLVPIYNDSNSDVMAIDEDFPFACYLATIVRTTLASRRTGRIARPSAQRARSALGCRAARATPRLLSGWIRVADLVPRGPTPTSQTLRQRRSARTVLRGTTAHSTPPSPLSAETAPSRATPETTSASTALCPSTRT